MARVPSLCHSHLPAINNFAQLGYNSMSMITQSKQNLLLEEVESLAQTLRPCPVQPIQMRGGNQKRTSTVLRTRYKSKMLMINVVFMNMTFNWTLITRQRIFDGRLYTGIS